MAEKEDLEELQRKLGEIAKEAMDAMRHSSEASAEMLPHMGQKTNDGAVHSLFKHYRKQMDAEVARHLKKYPD